MYSTNIYWIPTNYHIPVEGLGIKQLIQRNISTFMDLMLFWRETDNKI